ncbi:hypothetical protein FQV39_09410 [Bosea sp. F3-2]|uniref:hypothetical protein n=1 Tax=Bosea sp. F3-2 TaxID=2599640 RepID=UPI0011EF45D2|nr:hypothetical protein [Bosea sp. F3-2]QEL22758.1 hypothetical protein FQV39_09410 [Bosea sp. F3-2]
MALISAVFGATFDLADITISFSGGTMAERVKELLARDVETLRADVLKAGVLNAKALQESAENHVAHLNEVLRESQALQDASFLVVSRVIAFARLLYGQAAIAESEQARREALAAVSRLATVIDHAEWREESQIPA